MQALKLFFTGKNEVDIAREAMPEPAPDQVLVKATRSLISTGTESICYGRLFDVGTHWDSWVQYPFAPGYSLAGEVVAVGGDVNGFDVGDRVAAQAPHHQYVLARPAQLHHVPDEVGDDEAPWFALANITQIGVRHAAPALGETVAIVGQGLLGQLVTQYSRLLGARKVIVIDPAEERLAISRQHGATVALPMRVEQARDEVLRLTDGQGADIVYDITGIAGVFASALTLVRQFGRLILLGDTGSPTSQHLTMDVIRKGIRIIGAHAIHAPEVSTPHAYWSNQRMTQLFYTYLQRGDMSVSDLITHRFSPREAKSVYDMLQTDREKVMGVLFDWTDVA